jgi:quinoprotein glucose dehydrogenase
VYVIAYNFPTLIKLVPPSQGRQGGGGFGGRGAAQGPGANLYTTNCASCHGPNRAGLSGMPSLVGIAGRLNAAQIRTTILEGKGQMPGFHQLSGTDVDAIVTFLAAADAGFGRGGRGGGAPLTFPPGPIVETGPATTRPDTTSMTGGMTDYPAGVPAPAERLTMDGYGVNVAGRKPPYTTLTAYDLNKGTIKWQIGLGDDFRVLKAGGPKDTGAAITLKTSAIVTSAGLIFVPAADRKVHVYDADNGKELYAISMGAVTSGSPSMYELNGKQYLLVSASPVGTRQGGDDAAADPAQTGPTGLVAFALP